MFKTAYKLGEDIIGIMDFTDTNVNCVQVSLYAGKTQNQMTLFVCQGVGGGVNDN